MIVYKITNTLTGDIYIGQTLYSLAHRWSQHCSPKSKCLILRNAIQKYGKNAFSKVILNTYNSIDELNDAEEYFITWYNCVTPNGYNINFGGRNHTQSEQVKKKLSIGMTGNKNHQFGKKQSAETKLKRSLALKGKSRPQWVKDKISAGHNPKSDKNLTYRRKQVPAA